MTEKLLLNAITRALLDLEERGDIVICTNKPDSSARVVYEAVSELVPSDKVTIAELAGIRELILQAVSDQRFFDWEMPTLTGLTSDQFKEVANKLPKG